MLYCYTVFQTCSQCLPFGSGSEWLSCFAGLKPVHNACPWLFSLWVTTVPHCMLSLLTTPVLGSLVGKWLLCLAALSLLIMPALGSPVCEWLLCLATFKACLWHWFMALQSVSSCYAFLCFKSAHNLYPLLSREQVATVSCYISSLLTMPVFGSLVCKLLSCLSMFQACWWCLSLDIQSVSDCYALLCFSYNAYPWFSRRWVASCLLCFMHADDTCPLLSREWVTAIHPCASDLLMKPILCSLVCEWLLCLTVFQTCL